MHIVHATMPRRPTVRHNMFSDKARELHTVSQKGAFCLRPQLYETVTNSSNYAVK